MEPRTGRTRGMPELVDTLTLPLTGRRKNPIEAFLKEPLEIGHYSLVDSNGNTELHNDNRQMRTVSKSTPLSGWDAPLSSELCWDLSKGCDKIIQYSDSGEHKTHILDWILKNQEKIQRLIKLPNCKNIDFVCTRSLLKTISLTKMKSKWFFSACKYKSIIYIFYESVDRDYLRDERRHIDYGPIFEKYMTNGSLDESANKNEGYYVILKAELNDYTLLYSAEVDGKDPEIPQSHSAESEDLKSTKCYVELKTSTKTNYGHILQNWWLQAVLGGIPKIICGVRVPGGREGVVTELRTYHIKKEKKDDNDGEIFEPESIKKRKVDKEINVLYLDNEKEECLSICYEILSFVKKNVKEEKGVYYTFSHNPAKAETHEVNCEKISNSDIFKILPKSFTENYRILHQA